MTKIDYTPPHGLRVLMKAFADTGHQIRIVGGAVRDLLLGQEPKDVDLCTTATPEEMIALGKAYGFTVIPTGLQHGTVTFVMRYSLVETECATGVVETYEVTTLRIDVDTDGRHAEVMFTKSFEEDAARRDLTINAMSMDQNGNIYDYFGGIKDLETEVIRFVGDASERIQEDYLRILRAYRFAARFGCFIDPMNDKRAIRANVAGLAQISKERVWSEISKILTTPETPYSRRRWYTVAEMIKDGVFAAVGLPIDPRASVCTPMLNRMERADDAVSAISAFLTHDRALSFSAEWRMSFAEREKLWWLTGTDLNREVSLHAVEDMLVIGRPRNWVVSWCKMNGDNRLTYHAETWEIPTFPVRGQDLLDAGMKQGKEMGDRLAAMRKRWMQSRFVETTEELMNAVH